MSHLDLEYIAAAVSDGCWIWIREKELVPARRRFNYEHIRGPVSQDARFHDTCGHADCVNPDHLEIEKVPV